MKIAGFFAELKRRNVYKVAVAYAVVGWLVMQIAATVVPALHLPDGITSAVVVLTLLGFPIALVIAWAFEMTPEGMKRTENVSPNEVIPQWSARKFAATIVSLALLAAALFVFQMWRSKSISPAPSAASTVSEKSIAVLPFLNEGGDVGDEYFSDGLSEELIAALAQIGDLKVIGRSSSFRFKGKNEESRTIGEKLGVRTLLEGTVRKQGERVRIVAELVNATDGIELWTRTFDRELKDIFAVQEEIATAVAESLKVTLLGSEDRSAQKNATKSVEAHNAYLRGHFYFQRRNLDDYQRAVSYFDEAIRLDPDYALAYAERSEAWTMIGDLSGQGKTAWPKAREDAEKAVAIAPVLAEAHAALGWVRFFVDWQFAEGLSELKRAKELSPANPTANDLLARVIAYLGRVDEAERQARRAVELDPLSIPPQNNLARVLFVAGKLDEAVAVAGKAAELQPSAASSRRWQVLVAVQRGNGETALREAQLEPDEGYRRFELALAHYVRGDRAVADAALADLITNGRDQLAYQIAEVYAVRGEKDKAFEWLQIAFDNHDTGMLSLLIDPLLRGLHHDPRYHSLPCENGLAREAMSAREPSFFAELKRRNVYKVAIAYAVVGWLLIQVATQVFPFFEIPNWVVRLVVLVILIGFPIALVISWAFELTPEGLKRAETADADPQLGRRRKRVWIYVVLIAGASALGLFSIQHFSGWKNPAKEKATLELPAKSIAQPAATPANQPVDQKSIAVLAFNDLSPAHDQANFSDGMAEEILNALTRIRTLKVMARSSSFQFKGKDISPQQIGTELGVAHVLQGSVRKQGEQLRITATLVQTADGVQQWSNTYDGHLADVFKLQESCAHDIADQLNVVLGDDGKQRLVDKTTDNAEAYALFVEAQTLVNARVGDSLPRAIAMLEKVTALDPNFARAWSKLAVAHAVLPQYVGGDWAANLTIAESDAKRAIALDPDNAEAYAALGYVAFSRRRYVDMVAPAKRALALGPDDDTANFWASNELAAMGRTTEAEAILDRILVRDPANAPILFYKGSMRWRANDATTASTLAMRANALGFPLGGGTLASIFATKGDFDQGAAEFARGFGAIGAKFSSTQLQTIYRGMYLGATEHAAALAVIATHKNEQYVPTFLLMLGEPERSFAEYEKSATGLSDAYLNFLWQPDAWSRKARQSPAFQGFAKRIGMVDYWKQNRWPDLCSPTPENGPDAFTCR